MAAAETNGGHSSESAVSAIATILEDENCPVDGGRLSIRVAEMYKFNPRTLTKEEETIMEKTLEIIQDLSGKEEIAQLLKELKFVPWMANWCAVTFPSDTDRILELLLGVTYNLRLTSLCDSIDEQMPMTISSSLELCEEEITYQAWTRLAAEGVRTAKAQWCPALAECYAPSLFVFLANCSDGPSMVDIFKLLTSLIWFTFAEDSTIGLEHVSVFLGILLSQKSLEEEEMFNQRFISALADVLEICLIIANEEQNSKLSDMISQHIDSFVMKGRKYFTLESESLFSELLQIQAETRLHRI